MRWTGKVARMGDIKILCKSLVGKPESKKPFGRSWRGCEDNIKVYLKETGCEGVDLSHMTQSRLF
jgi:hypothetical protein